MVVPESLQTRFLQLQTVTVSMSAFDAASVTVDV